jgi:hypothetical protein
VLQSQLGVGSCHIANTLLQTHTDWQYTHCTGRCWILLALNSERFVPSRIRLAKMKGKEKHTATLTVRNKKKYIYPRYCCNMSRINRCQQLVPWDVAVTFCVLQVSCVDTTARHCNYMNNELDPVTLHTVCKRINTQ